MKSKTTTDEDQLIHFEQTDLSEVRTDRDATEESKYERERIGNDMLKEQLEGRRQDREERKKFGTYVFWLIVGYLIAVFVLLILAGFGALFISEGVQIALLGTFSANVLGLFWMVMNYLFSK